MPVQPVATVVAQMNAAAIAIVGSFPTEAAQCTDAADTLTDTENARILTDDKRAAAIVELNLQLDQLREHVRTFGVGNGNAQLAIDRAVALLPSLA